MTCPFTQGFAESLQKGLTRLCDTAPHQDRGHIHAQSHHSHGVCHRPSGPAALGDHIRANALPEA